MGTSSKPDLGRIAFASIPEFDQKRPGVNLRSPDLWRSLYCEKLHLFENVEKEKNRKPQDDETLVGKGDG